MRVNHDPVGVVGLGMGGGALAGVLPELGLRVRGYDPYLQVGRPEDLGPCPVTFVCVPSPAERGQRHDVSAVWDAVSTIAPFLRDGAVIAVKSTVPPGTCDELSRAFPSLEFVSCPEFLVAAAPVETLRRPDRVVIGGRSPKAVGAVRRVMELVSPEAPIVVLDPVEAELAKLCSNALLAAKVALANELFEVCAAFGAAWERIETAVGLDRRIGPEHLHVTAERGFGGRCLPKDLDGFVAAALLAGHRPEILETVAEFNRSIRCLPQLVGSAPATAPDASAPQG
jgi:UDPglucose 6-dehydrogenase